MAYYADDDDMRRYCEQIASAMTAGDYAEQHEEAARVIDRDIVRGWYRPQCLLRNVDWTTVEFDRAKIENLADLVALGAFQALALAGERLSQNGATPEARDQWQEIRDHFRARYEEELAAVLDVGIVYDWTTGEDDVIATREPRRLRRS